MPKQQRTSKRPSALRHRQWLVGVLLFGLFVQLFVPAGLLMADEVVEQPIVEQPIVEQPAPEPDVTVIATGDATASLDAASTVNDTVTTLEEPIEEPIEELPALSESLDEQTVDEYTPPQIQDGEAEEPTGTPSTTPDISSEPDAEELEDLSVQHEVPAPDGCIVDTSAAPLQTPTTSEDLFDTSLGNTDNSPSTEPVLIVENTNTAEVATDGCVQSETGDNQASDNAGDVVVSTGDATTDVVVDNQVNTNTLDPNLSALADTCQSPDGCLGDITVSNTSTATTTTTVQADAATGENQATDNAGDVEILTGDAQVDVNISNIVNTNVTGDGTLLAVDLTDQVIGDLDFSGGFSQGQDQGALASEHAQVRDVVVNNANDANVTNTLSVTANTGDNQANGNAGHALIVTGDANAQVNISNIVNTNIIGTGWQFSVLNVFGDWQGNLYLPAMQQALHQSTGQAVGVQVANANSAGVLNDISVLASSGENQAEGDGQSTIITGQAQAVTNVLNVLNSNIFSSHWDFVKINTFGAWQGQVYGLPQDAEYIETADGLLIWNGQTVGDALVVEDDETYQFSDGPSVIVQNQNDATVSNIVTVAATTGGNTASNNQGNGTISTGDATATVNVANYVNTNLVGDNWMYALVNVFGSWQGNLEFGRPDLWIEETHTLQFSPLGVGERVTYHFQYGNRGNAVAENVVISDNFAADILDLIDAAGGTVLPDGGMSWDIGTLTPDQTGEISYSLRLTSDHLPAGTYEVSNEVEIGTSQSDSNLSDNISGSMFTGVIGSANAGQFEAALGDGLPPSGPGGWQSANLEIIKTHNAPGLVEPGSTVSYTLVVKNLGDLSAYDTIVEDTMLDSQGAVVAQNQWPLDEVFGHEEITITYDVQIIADAPFGTYTNTARAEGWDDKLKRWVLASATTDIEVGQSQDALNPEPDIVLPVGPEEAEEANDDQSEQSDQGQPIAGGNVKTKITPGNLGSFDAGQADQLALPEVSPVGSVLGAAFEQARAGTNSIPQGVDIYVLFIWLTLLIAAYLYLAVRAAFLVL